MQISHAIQTDSEKQVMLGARPTTRERTNNVLAVASTEGRALPASVINRTVQSAVLIQINLIPFYKWLGWLPDRSMHATSEESR